MSEFTKCWKCGYQPVSVADSFNHSLQGCLFIKKIHEGYDHVLKCNYNLYSMSLKSLKRMVLTWYKGYDFSKYDTDYDINTNNPHHKESSNEFSNITKETGLTCNFFFAQKQGNEYYLLDGFNRILTDYSEVNEETIVYLKLITDYVKDHEITRIMFRLNLWKLFSTRNHGFSTKKFLDRGFRLLIHKRFNIFINENNDSRHKDSDFELLDSYFNCEKSYADYFRLDYTELEKLFSNEQTINDFCDFITNNAYSVDENTKIYDFKHYEKFLKGYVMFISRRRIAGDDSVHKFQDYLAKLKNDKSFFKKLQKMSWTDSTRKNIYNWFHKMEEELKNGI